MKPFQSAVLFIMISGLLQSAKSHAVSLSDCLQAARDANPSLKAASQRVLAASSAIETARSGYYPTVGIAGSYTLTDNPPQAFFMNLNQRVASFEEDFNQPDDTDNIRGSLLFRMLLLDAGQRGLMAEMAESGRNTAEHMKTAVHNELEYEVTRAYHSVLQASAMLAVHEETLGSIEENLRVARERLSAGTVIKTDVLNLDVQLARARENLIRARNGVQLAIAALNTAIGDDLVSSSSELTPVDADSTSPPPATVEFDAVDSRPEVLAMSERSESAAIDASRIRRENWPKVSAFGSLDVDSGDANDFEDSYLVGAMVEMDIFTGFRRHGEQAEASAKAGESLALLEQLRDQLVLDLTRSHLMTLESWERWQVAEASRSSAEEALRITRERYEQGAADITELLTAQVSKTESNSRAVAAQYDYLISRANLARAQGLSQELN